MHEESTDDILEAARSGQSIQREETCGPAIGGSHIIRESAAPKPQHTKVFRCGGCGAIASGWHRGHELTDPTPFDWDDVGEAYHQQLRDAMSASRLDKWLEWGPDEWRPIPGFENYEMNGYDRHVRRRAYTRTLKSGVVRSYEPREVQARKSSVTLSQDGVSVSRGIEKLWRATFPDYVQDENSWNVHSMRSEGVPAGYSIDHVTR